MLLYLYSWLSCLFLEWCCHDEERYHESKHNKVMKLCTNFNVVMDTSVWKRNRKKLKRFLCLVLKVVLF